MMVLHRIKKSRQEQAPGVLLRCRDHGVPGDMAGTPVDDLMLSGHGVSLMAQWRGCWPPRSLQVRYTFL